MTALSPRRIVIGKLLAQAVKLATLFAGLAPFIAMSFLLGGIDFATILVSLLVLFLWSLWACAVCLCLSSLIKRARCPVSSSGAVGVLLFLMLVVFVLPRVFYFGRGGFAGAFVFGFGATGSQSWWVLAITTTVCLATMVNLVLLAENRLSLPSEDRVTALRVGFLLQFLLIAAWTLSFVGGSLAVRSNAVQALGVLGGLHLAVVAMFTVTEDLVVSRRVLLRIEALSRWRRLLAMFRPGAGRGALYVLVQMALLVAVAWRLRPTWPSLRWFLAICGYICFFTGVPAAAFRFMRPTRAASFHLRVAVLVLLPIAMVLPDILFYMLWQPDVFDLKYSARHLLNPFRTLANWAVVGDELLALDTVRIGPDRTVRLSGADLDGPARDGPASPDRSARFGGGCRRARQCRHPLLIGRRFALPPGFGWLCHGRRWVDGSGSGLARAPAARSNFRTTAPMRPVMTSAMSTGPPMRGPRSWPSVSTARRSRLVSISCSTSAARWP